MTRHTPGLLTVLLAFIVLVCGALSASAQALTSYRGALYCEGNRALILLGGVSLEEAYESLPSGTAKFAPKSVGTNECTLADGREVRVKIGERRSKGFGMCDAGQEGFTSLWIGQKKVVRRGNFYSICWPGMSDLYYVEGQDLTACTSENLTPLLKELFPDFPEAQQTCHDVSDLLAEAEFDPVEYPLEPGERLPFGKIRVSYAEHEDFCTRFLSKKRLPEGYAEEILVEANFLGPITDPSMFAEGTEDVVVQQDYIQPIAEMSDRPAFVDLSQRLPHAESLTKAYLEGVFFVSEFDFDNDGIEDTVIRESFRGGYFYGDRFLVRPKTESDGLLKTLDDVFDKKDRFERHEIADQVERVFGGVELDDPEGDIRYRLQIVFRYDDETLVFTSRFNGYTGATIYRPRPGGVEEPVCIFERRPENY